MPSGATECRSLVTPPACPRALLPAPAIDITQYRGADVLAAAAQRVACAGPEPAVVRDAPAADPAPHVRAAEATSCKCWIVWCTAASTVQPRRDGGRSRARHLCSASDHGTILGRVAAVVCFAAYIYVCFDNSPKSTGNLAETEDVYLGTSGPTARRVPSRRSPLAPLRPPGPGASQEWPLESADEAEYGAGRGDLLRARTT